MSVSWTEEQREVIGARDTNLLVSAAAGSGKTAVLVERILSLITDPERKIDVDRLLITTFTKAAASEMRGRIGRALSDRLLKEPDNEWLQRQEALLSRAQITTIHGFCLYVIRNYFHTIDLNPNFRIADEGEMRLLKQDTAEEILEEAYQEHRPEFIRFAEGYGSGNQGNGLPEMILKLYEYAVAFPQPGRWLRESAAAYELPEDAGWEDIPGADALLAMLRTTVRDCRAQIAEALRLTRLPGGPAGYEETLQGDDAQLLGLLDARSVGAFGELLSCLSFGRLPSRRSKAMAGADDGLCDRVIELRDSVKAACRALLKQYFQLPEEEVAEKLRSAAESARVYTELTLRFMERLQEKKRRKNILDFTDQEHLALRILTREEDGRLVPSQTADAFADYFAEIMVDEYQDSNLVQEAILTSICGSRKGRDNRFMVGDVKQSIYRFRQAEPGLFLEKYSSYGDAAEGKRIDLSRNFRSRKEVLDAVNEIFSHIMRRELGGIDYDDTAALKAGAVYPENEACRAELLLLPQEEWEGLRGESDWTKAETEAHLVAARIRRMLSEEQVTKDGALRAVRPGDIVILLRTMSGLGETFVRVLQEEGIPASAQSREGYFSAPEVETLLSYLRVLDNPTQEIPLAAAMHGMLGGFSSAELAAVKAAYPDQGFAAACRSFCGGGEDGALKDKLTDFFGRIGRYRELAACEPIHELLWRIVTETGFLDEARALPGGEQRLANVQMLLQKAQDYEKISYHGLFHFVRYIERMQKYQMDFGEADVSGEGGEAVRIMSIHHSKGLEFPVVFVAGTGRSFNRQESRDRAVFHREYGIGLDAVDLKTRQKRPTILKQLIRRQNLLDSLGEELRVLYVAMTRAKEKLILTGMAKESLRTEPGCSGDAPLLFLKLAGADSFLAWLMAGRRAEGSALSVTEVSLRRLLSQAVQEQVKGALTRDELERTLLFGKKDEALYTAIDERLSWKYPWDTGCPVKQKYSVTELKKLGMQEESDAGEELYPESDVIPLIPQFIERTEQKTGAARGTVYHTVMEWLDFAALLAAREEGGRADVTARMEEELSELVRQGRLSEEDLRSVRAADFTDFVYSGLAERMQRAKERGELWREQPFVIGIPETEVGGSGADETVLIQGIIDAFFREEDGRLVVVDYKTDRVSRPEELSEKYRAQLDWYDRALRMMTGSEVRERLIYSFTLGRVIPV